MSDADPAQWILLFGVGMVLSGHMAWTHFFVKDLLRRVARLEGNDEL